MKILIVSQYFYPEEFRINEIAKELVKKGNDVTVLTGLPNYPKGKVLKEYKFLKKRNEIIDGIKVKRCFEIGRRSGNIFRMLNYLSYAISASIKAIFMGSKYDIVYVYQLSPITLAIPAIVYKKIYKKKLILYCLDLWPESMLASGMSSSSKIYKYIKKISEHVYNNCDKILVTSKSFIEVIKNKLNENNKDKIKVNFLPQHAEIVECDEKSKEKNVFDFVFAGNVGKAQSVETIIKAAEILREYKNIIFHIVGDGSELQNIIQYAEKSKLDNVKFYGRKPQSEMNKYYSFADAMLVTLNADEFANKTLPGKVQSYMGARKPIIAAASGETYNAILDAKCGYCVQSEDYKMLAKIILKFVKQEEKDIDIMANNSYEYFINNYAKEKHIDEISKIMLENI